MWNIPKLLAEFPPGYKIGIVPALVKAGLPVPSRDAFMKWRRRGRLPSDYLACIFIARPDLDPRDYLIDPLATHSSCDNQD